MKNPLGRMTLLLVFFLFIFLIISYTRGYRFNFKEKKISSTGILAISSSPKAAKVYINGHLKGATDLNITLRPGVYTIEINKEGYMPYKTTITLRGELVETIDPILFPNNPSLSPLSNLGIVKAVRVDQSDNIILISENESDKDGIYLFNAETRPITIFAPLKVLVLKKMFPANLSLKNSEIIFSPDYKQALIEIPSADKTALKTYLVNLGVENQDPFDVTASKNTLIDAWDEEKNREIQKILEALPIDIQKTASSSFKIIAMSPDQNKILYRSNSNTKIPVVINPPLIASNQTKESRDIGIKNIYVYDKREDKNFKIADSSFDENNLIWYSDSKRLVYKDSNKISISYYDGTNKQNVYSGPLEEDFFAINSEGRLLILSNLNPKSNILPDLYLVGIR